MAWNRSDEKQQLVAEPVRPAQQTPAPAPNGAAVLGRNVTVKGEIFSRAAPPM